MIKNSNRNDENIDYNNIDNDSSNNINSNLQDIINVI